MFSVQMGESVERLHESCHWVTVSLPTESATSVVCLYDSSKKESLNKNLVRQIARLRKSEELELEEFLQELLQTISRTTINLNKEIRSRAENETMTTFPQQTR